MSVDMIKNIEALDGIKVDASAYADLIHERNTLVTALRECVVALDPFPELTEKDDLAVMLGWKERQRKEAQDRAKSTLERYKHEHT